MEVVPMQIVEFGLEVGIVLVEYEFAFPVPPEPVLNDVVHRNVELAIFVGSFEQLGLT